MKDRCYNTNSISYVSYGARGVTVCTEWHDYKTFKNWYDSNYYELPNERVTLDKDLFGGKIYSPDTCIFLPNTINCTLMKGHSKTSGCSIHGNKWEVRLNNPISRKLEYVGLYDTSEEGRKVYLSRKSEILHELTETYNGLIPERVYQLLINYDFK